MGKVRNVAVLIPRMGVGASARRYFLMAYVATLELKTALSNP